MKHACNIIPFETKKHKSIHPDETGEALPIQNISEIWECEILWNLFLWMGGKYWKTCFKNWNKYKKHRFPWKKHGLLLSLALKTAPLKGPQMQAASLHLISTNGRARRSMVFYGVLMCSLLVRFHANILDVVNVVMSNPWMSMVDLGTLGSSKWWISKDFQLGYQGGMYLSNEEQHDNFFYPLHS